MVDTKNAEIQDEVERQQTLMDSELLGLVKTMRITSEEIEVKLLEITADDRDLIEHFLADRGAECVQMCTFSQ